MHGSRSRTNGSSNIIPTDRIEELHRNKQPELVLLVRTAIPALFRSSETCPRIGCEERDKNGTGEKLTVQAVCASAQTPDNTTKLMGERTIFLQQHTSRTRGHRTICSRNEPTDLLMTCKSLLAQFSMNIRGALTTMHLHQTVSPSSTFLILAIDGKPQ